MYKVRIDAFEGPFDLLVYLIENAEMSIYDINISDITSQYMDYIRQMKDESITVAQEFMVLAASLIEIKSRMMLPRMIKSDVSVVDEDPRNELIERILEYKKFKKLSLYLKAREEKGLRIFEKPQEDISRFLDHPDDVLELELDEFVDAFSKFIGKKQKIETVRRHYTQLENERATTESCIKAILKKLRGSGESMDFRELLYRREASYSKGRSGDTYDVVLTLVALLEMAKERVVELEQKSVYGHIEVTPGEMIDSDEILKRYSEEIIREDADDYKENN